MDTTQLLLEFSALYGISGREQGAFAFAKQHLGQFGTVTETPTGSLVCTVKEPEQGGTHVMLDAHLDEIGFMVSHVLEDGFLKVSPAGGVDRRLVLSSLVDIHTTGGILTGVISSTPPHLLKGERKNPEISDIFIDVGLSGEEAKEKIKVGDMITFRSRPVELLENNVSGKALDDRAGCVALLKALEYLGEDIPVGLTVVFSSMEEIGLHGARTAAYQVDPTHALVVDVGFAHTPDAKKADCGELGKGPMVGFAPILRHEFSTQLVNLAKEQDIPYQTDVMGRGTGTNSDAVAVARAGVPTALLSIPQRYMHTPYEVVNVNDVENTGKLIAAWISQLGKGDA